MTKKLFLLLEQKLERSEKCITLIVPGETKIISMSNVIRNEFKETGTLRICTKAISNLADS